MFKKKYAEKTKILYNVKHKKEFITKILNNLL